MEKLRGGNETTLEVTPPITDLPIALPSGHQPVKPRSSNWEVLSNHTFILRPLKETSSNPGSGRRARNKPRSAVPEVFITHAGHLVIDSKNREEEIKSDNSSQNNSSDIDEDKELVKCDPCRKNTLSSGEVTVIIKHDADSDTLGRKRFKHKTVTNIFSSDVGSDTRKSEKSDSQLLFNIEALKIAKRAHDLKELNSGKGKNTKKVRTKLFFHQLRKFKSLPNLSAIRNLTMRKIKSKLDLDENVSSSDKKNIFKLKGQFGTFNVQAYYTARTFMVLECYLINNKVGIYSTHENEKGAS